MLNWCYQAFVPLHPLALLSLSWLCSQAGSSFPVARCPPGLPSMSTSCPTVAGIPGSNFIMCPFLKITLTWLWVRNPATDVGRRLGSFPSEPQRLRVGWDGSLKNTDVLLPIRRGGRHAVQITTKAMTCSWQDNTYLVWFFLFSIHTSSLPQLKTLTVLISLGTKSLNLLPAPLY